MHCFDKGWKYGPAEPETNTAVRIHERRQIAKPESGTIHWALYIVIGVIFLTATILLSSQKFYEAVQGLFR